MKTARRLKPLGFILMFLSVVLVGFFTYSLITKKLTSIKEIEFETPATIELSETAYVLSEPEKYPKKFYYDSGIDIPYPPDGVKGIYMSAYGFANNEIRERNLNLIRNSNLNAMVIDVKDDYGTILFDFESDNPLILENTSVALHAKDTLKLLEQEQIYPIARIVAFKDSSFAKKHPEYAFRNPDGSVWTNRGGEAFINPFLQEVWDYTIAVSIEAAKAGFKEIQYDYIRFAEGFSLFEPNLSYSWGMYQDSDKSKAELRVQVINDFIDYAKQKLEPYNVDIGIDIFGYTATVPEDSDIGQNFTEISKRADVVSSMIYPSHWGPGYFGLVAPDKQPYEVVKFYIQDEMQILNSIDNKPITRPWLQDFTASYLGPDWYIPYTAAEVKAQVQALKDVGINEFLLWNAANYYNTVNGDY